MLAYLNKDIFGALSVLIALIAYSIYAWQTITGQTRPHPLSWLIFAILTGTGFWIQLDEGAGAGSWVMGSTAAISLLLCVLSVWRGERKFPWYEWTFLVASAFVFLFYVASRQPDLLAGLITMVAKTIGHKTNLSSDQFLGIIKEHGPAISALLATMVDVLGYGPTVTKAWSRPHTESYVSFGLNGVKFVPSLLAMDTVSIATCVYPATLVVVNIGVALLVWWRQQTGAKGNTLPA